MAKQAMAPLLKNLPAPIFNWMGAMPFPAIKALFDPFFPEGLAVVLEGRLREDRCPTKRSTRTSRRRPEPRASLSLMHLYPIDGAVHRVAKDATAWSARDATCSMVIAGIDPDPEEGRRA